MKVILLNEIITLYFVEVFKDMSEQLKKFREEYFSNEILDIYHFFTKEQLDLIEKLGLKIEDKKYSVYDFDVLEMDIGKYYREPKMLEEKGITKEELMAIIEIFDKISEENNL